MCHTNKLNCISSFPLLYSNLFFISIRRGDQSEFPDKNQIQTHRLVILSSLRGLYGEIPENDRKNLEK